VLFAQVAVWRHAAGTGGLHRDVFVARDNTGIVHCAEPADMLRLLITVSFLLFVLFLYAQATTARAGAGAPDAAVTFRR
jgi:hypothetical protein